MHDIRLDNSFFPAHVHQAVTLRNEARTGSGLWLPPGMSTRNTIGYTDVAVVLSPVTRKSPRLLIWGAIVGDVVHNLASALDNIVAALAAINPSPPVAHTAAERQVHSTHRRTQGFPSCGDRRDWPSQMDRYLFFVDRDLVHRLIEPLQPFVARERRGLDPKHHPLRILHDLWNRDKHHAINLCLVASEFHGATARIPVLFGDQVLHVEVIERYPLRPIKQKTIVGVVRIRFPYEVDFAQAAEVPVFVDPRIALGVVFGEGIPAEGDSLFEKLQEARDMIIDLINVLA